MASNKKLRSRGGYDIEFIGNEPNHVTCCICLLVLRGVYVARTKPMQAEKYDHSFCISCVQEIRKW